MVKLSEFMQKQREIESAKRRYEEAQRKLKDEKKKWRQEHPLPVVKQFKELKPWTRSDIVLLVLMLILFSFAYFKDDSGFSFGFSTGNSENNELSTGAVGDSTETTEETTSEDTTEETEIDDSTTEETTSDEDTSDDSTTSSDNPVDFTLKATYNNKEFTSLSLPNGTSMVNYYLAFENKETSKMRCEGTSSYLSKSVPSNFFIDAGKEKSIWAKVTAEESNKKVIVTNKFECYEEDNKYETLKEKELKVTFHFGDIS